MGRHYLSNVTIVAVAASVLAVLALAVPPASATTSNQSYVSGGSQAASAVAGDGGHCALLKGAKVACWGDQVDDESRAPMTTATVPILGGSIAERSMSAAPGPGSGPVCETVDFVDVPITPGVTTYTAYVTDTRQGAGVYSTSPPYPGDHLVVDGATFNAPAGQHQIPLAEVGGHGGPGCVSEAGRFGLTKVLGTTSTKYDISGTVTGPDGKPVAGVVIDVRDANGVVVASATTDGHGHYQTIELDAGQYFVEPATNRDRYKPSVVQVDLSSSSGIANFSPFAQVVVTGVDPPEGSPNNNPTTGETGQEATVSGTGFEEAGTRSEVGFCTASGPSDCVGAIIVSRSDTAIRLQIPPLPTVSNEPPRKSPVPMNVVVKLLDASGAVVASSTDPPPTPQFSYVMALTSVVPSPSSPGPVKILGSGFGIHSWTEDLWFCIPGVSPSGPNPGHDGCIFVHGDWVNDGEIDANAPRGPVVMKSLNLGALPSGTFTSDVYLETAGMIAGPVPLQSTLALGSITPEESGPNPLIADPGLDLSGTGFGPDGTQDGALFCPAGVTPYSLTGDLDPRCLVHEGVAYDNGTELGVYRPFVALGVTGGTFNSERFDVYVRADADAYQSQLTGGYAPVELGCCDHTYVYSDPHPYTIELDLGTVRPTLLAAGGGTKVEIFGSGFGDGDTFDLPRHPNRVLFCPTDVRPALGTADQCALGTSEVTRSDGREITVVAPAMPAGTPDGVRNLWVQVVGDYWTGDLTGKVIAVSLPQRVTYTNP
ncbi:MAG: carboxypeptidase regulatory-like domain-containing protein [Acidimicrobiales bacterium]